MKYSRLSLLFSAALIFLNTSSYAIMLEQNAIDKKAIEIEKKLTQERYLMYGLTTIAIAHEIYQWVPLLKDFMVSPSPTGVIEDKKLSFFQSLKEGLQHLFYTKEGLISLIQSGFSVGGFVIISQMSEKFMHPDTLRWYINARAPYHVTIKLMKERLHDLQDPSIDQEQWRVSNEMLPLLYGRLVRQAENMCAYMTYKTKHLGREEKIIAEHAKISMLKSHNNWLARIAEQLNLDNRDFAALETLIDSYEKVIASQVNHFALIEDETQRERVVVKKQMKKMLDQETEKSAS